MTEYQREQQAFHANRERLKAGAGDETGPSVTSPVYSPVNRRRQLDQLRPFGADSVAKVFLRGTPQNLWPVGAAIE